MAKKCFGFPPGGLTRFNQERAMNKVATVLGAAMMIGFAACSGTIERRRRADARKGNASADPHQGRG